MKAYACLCTWVLAAVLASAAGQPLLAAGSTLVVSVPAGDFTLWLEYQDEKGVRQATSPVKASGAKVALATINLEDGDLAGYEYVVDVDNLVVAAESPYSGLQPKGKADLDPGDQVAIEITTQAAGGAGIAGDFQPFFCWHNRAESEENTAKLVNRTPTTFPTK